jgi:hypothetical protein
LQLSLFHKPRGGKGVWNVISQNDPIRVTPRVGKHLRLNIRSSQPFEAKDVTVWLIDKTLPEDSCVIPMSEPIQQSVQHDTAEIRDQDRPTYGFCAENNITIKTDASATSADMQIKLFHFSKALFFRVAIRNVGQVDSVTFNTHNSGKQR